MHHDLTLRVPGYEIPTELDLPATFAAAALTAMTPNGLASKRACDAVDPVGTIAAVDTPALIMQDGRDSSVPLDAWVRQL